MGFGFLLVGYFTTAFTATMMSATMSGGFFAFFGYLMMIFGARKLMQYNKSFLYLLISCLVMTAFSSLFALRDVFSILHAQMIIPSVPIDDGMYNVLLHVRLVLDLVFVAVLCYCVKSIAKESGAEKIAFSSVRNFVFYCIYFVMQVVVISSQYIAGMEDFLKMTLLSIWTVLLQFVCMLFISFMLFSCYSKICDSEDVDMSPKPSRFEFINRRREENALRDQQYLEEMKKRREEKMLRKKQKSEEKSNKK